MNFEIIPSQLYFWVVDSDFVPPKNTQDIYFSTEFELIYTSFFADFGPLDIGKTYEFCRLMEKFIEKSNKSNVKIIYYCQNHPYTMLNSAVLIISYMIFVRNCTLFEAYGPFYESKSFTTYRDAAFCLNTFPITLLDCAMAMRRVKDLYHYDHASFDHLSFMHLTQLQNGDISWIVPHKFIAFSGPMSKRRVLESGKYALSASDYVPLFQKLGVTCVIRFNNKCYNKNVFTDAGIRHIDLFYEDGGNPTQMIMQKFLQVCEKEKGAIAVHCKAGLGRTGTNIAAYMIKHYDYSAREASAWCRICRPGSVVGPQQQFLVSVESQLKAEGRAWRQRYGYDLLLQNSIKRPNEEFLQQFGLADEEKSLKKLRSGFSQFST